MNTIGTSTTGQTWRRKYFGAKLQQVLRNALVTEAITKVDRSGARYIANPYSSAVTAALQAVAGTYSVSAWTTTDDNLSVTDEAIYGEHVFDFERVMSNYDLRSDRFDNMAYGVSAQIDKFVLNNLCEDGTGTYTTPVGGFTTAANWTVILSNLISKVAGYESAYQGLFLVLENTDLVGVIQSQMASGFNFADMALKNGLVANQAGVDIYVVRSGTFVSDTLGTTTVTNSGHRVFGVKGVASVLLPGDFVYDEKGVSGKTGKEISVSQPLGFKLWTQNAGLVVDITLA